MILVYVAGPFSAPTREGVEEHITRAVQLGLEVAKLGFYPVIPHANTAHPEFEKIQPYDFWIKGTREMLRRACDALVLVPGWEASNGAMKERADMIELGKPAFESIDLLRAWRDLLSKDSIATGLSHLGSGLCPRCRSSRIDTSLRKDPASGDTRKRCHCDQCGHKFWRSEGLAEGMKELPYER